MVPPKFYELDLFFPVFSNYKVKIVITREPIQVARYIADRDYLREPQPREVADAFTTSGHGYSFVYLRPDTEIGTIAHEMYHAVEGLMDFIFPGAKRDEEVVAYHLGYIVDKAVEFNLKVAPRFEIKAKREAAQKIKSDRAKSFERRQK